MAFEAAKEHLTRLGYGSRIREFSVSSATVELAAKALGTEPQCIAKSLTFLVDKAPVMVVCAGDAKISNAKFKAFFHTKAKMLAGEEVEPLIGHGVGGVCPFGVLPGVRVYLDTSLRRFGTVYPACGSANSAVELTLAELEEAAAPLGWADVCTVPA